MRIPLPARVDCGAVERAVDQAIAECGLKVMLRGTLAKFPGCVHWHVKRGREAGTLEITYWPGERRAWFTVQMGRRGEWIEEMIVVIKKAIRRRV